LPKNIGKKATRKMLVKVTTRRVAWSQKIKKAKLGRKQLLKGQIHKNEKAEFSLKSSEKTIFKVKIS